MSCEFGLSFSNAKAALPETSRTWSSLTSSLLNQNRYDEALDPTQKAVQIDTASFDAYFTMSLAHFYKGQMDEAERSMKKVIEIAPRLTQAWEVLAEIYKKKGQAQEAENALKRIDELRDQESYHILGFGGYRSEKNRL
ncbi:MAG: tetratricopeptide repeat protein [Candidatus Thorarchaeota archaeon]|nr:MAG: tetratricopeptide repeat protein [Candidatus Thorarchaeota archaeon]